MKRIATLFLLIILAFQTYGGFSLAKSTEPPTAQLLSVMESVYGLQLFLVAYDGREDVYLSYYRKVQ